MAAQSGIAGSASLGNRVLVGGQVGMFVHGLHVRVCAWIACACMCMHCICIPGMTCGQLSPQCYMWQRNKQWCPPPADPRATRPAQTSSAAPAPRLYPEARASCVLRREGSARTAHRARSLRAADLRCSLSQRAEAWCAASLEIGVRGVGRARAVAVCRRPLTRRRAENSQPAAC